MVYRLYTGFNIQGFFRKEHYKDTKRAAPASIKKKHPMQNRVSASQTPQSRKEIRALELLTNVFITPQSSLAKKESINLKMLTTTLIEGMLF